MRKLYLWWQNTKTHIILDIFLLFAITLSLFYFSNALGTYRMTVLCEELLNDTIENKKSVYYMELYDAMQRLDVTAEESIAENISRYENIKKLRSEDCVEAVHTRAFIGSHNADAWHNVIIYNMESISMFPELYRGSWFDEAQDEHGNFNAVVYGSQYKNMELGSIITTFVNGKELNIKVCGEIYESLPIPMFDGSGSYSNVNSIYSIGDNGIIIFECDPIMDYVWDSDSTKNFIQYDNFIVEFKETATEQQIKPILDNLSKYGGVSYFDSIFENTREYIDELFKIKMTVPMFYTVISFSAFLCITILYVIKRSKEMSVYHILGYSKHKMAASIVLRVLLLLLTSATINVLYVENYYTLLAKDIIKTEVRPPYFDEFSTLIIVGISIIMLIIVAVASVCTLYSNAPREMQNLSQE